MADTTRNIWNDADEEKASPQKRKGLWGLLSFFLILVVVLGVVLIAAYRGGTGFDVLRRYLHYGASEDVGGESIYDYDASASNRFGVVGNHLVVLSETVLQVLSPNGETVWSKNVNMSVPALDVGNELAVAYDVGGTQLYVVNQQGEVMILETEEKESLFAANLNDCDWLTITSEKQNYKGHVQVYSPEMELVFAFNSSRRFVMDACVLGEGLRMAAVTLGQENSTFVSNVVLYDLQKTEPDTDYDIEDGLVVAIETRGEKIVTVSDTCLTYADSAGKVLATYGYSDEYLREYDLAGDDFAILQLNRYQSGSMGRLVSVGSDGSELGVLDVNEEIMDISAAGRYVAVLYADRVVVYNPDLQVYSSLSGADQARGILMRADGSVLLLDAESAQLFLP